jgi:D-beta-D-heptose 7-phosphate kinase/D-beta-D-heptose 1-phosphate adenosyltransferase
MAQIDKICSLPVLLEKLALWRTENKKIVFTNGCFDLLHAGHVIYLEKAKACGDVMVLGLNSDASVRGLKGEGRPVVVEDDRARVIAALESVDAVIIFNEDTPRDLIVKLRPDVLVKGDDYTEEQIAGAKEVRSWGGDVVLIPLVEGRSTTSILQKNQGVK